LTSLRALTTAALASLVVVLMLPASGLAHIIPQPDFIARGAEITIFLDVPNERAPHATVAVDFTAPPGFSVVSAEPTKGWKATIAGPTVTWAGGRLTGGDSVRFGVGLVTNLPPGPVTLDAVQRYDDHQSVTWRIPFSVVPGAVPTSSGMNAGRIALAAIVAAGIVAATLGLLLRSRRRRRRSS